MRELRDILTAFEDLCAEGATGVLCSVVHAAGSTYRRPGARMLALPDDTLIGLIGGGCLEGDLLEQSKEVRASGVPRVVRYDATAEDDVVWGLGLGCAGVVHVLLERVGREEPGPLAFLADCAARRRRGALATVVEGEALGRRWTLGADGPVCPPLRGDAERAIERALRLALDSGRNARLALGERTLWVEVVEPPLRLVLFGGGPDAVPLVRIAAALGWDVSVWDGRPAYARPDRLPGARAVRLCPFEEAVEAAEPDAETFAVVMTHHYLHDRALLRRLLPSAARYVGLLGPKRRTEDLLRDLAADGVPVTEEQRARLFGPAGLDIGAEGPEEIALALAAEIQTVAAGRSGGWLRDRKGPIHDPPA